VRIEPLRIIAKNGRRRSGQCFPGEGRPLAFRQRRGREARSAAQSCDLFNIKTALATQHAKECSARVRFAHEPSRRRFAAKRIVDEPGDSGSIRRSGETVDEAPVLEHICSRPPPRFDVGNHLNGG
jgi:hypothetical protein